MFGGKRVDRVRDAQRIREIQDLIRTIAGNVDDNGKEMARVKEMMKARTPPVTPKVAPPAPVPPIEERPRAVPPPYQPAPPPRAPVIEPQRAPPQAPPFTQMRDRPVFCIHCGSRLPLDGLGCRVCASRNTKICPNCGTRVSSSMVTCPICRRVMPQVVPYQRH